MTHFDGVLPGRPQIIPPELASLSVDNTGGSDWSTKVPPEAVGYFIGTVVSWLSDPRFGVAVQVDTSEAGWVISVSLPVRETREDITLH